MDAQRNDANRPVNPRRKKRSKLQIIKEAYLPVVIVAVALILILTFIIGSVTRSSQREKMEQEASIAASLAQQQEEQRLKAQAEDLVSKAQKLMQDYDYHGALTLLGTFEGDPAKYPALAALKASCQDTVDNMVEWNDPSKVLNLSFQVLIADPARAFNDDIYGTSYNRNFVTTDEFSAILEQLYRNGYILVSPDDFIGCTVAANGAVTYSPKSLYLPAGKKPVVLTQTQINYYTYMTDSNGDKLPDKGGDGFASRLMLDGNGNLTCEMVTATGSTVTGDFDLVPILNRFIRQNPTFSYKGARAILAVTGYDGLFGYRTNKSAVNTFGQAEYDRQVAEAKAVIQALRNEGYDLACYTYDNIPYGNRGKAEIQLDLNHWKEEVTPILGETDILVFAQNSDIAEANAPYSNDKYGILAEAGFSWFYGFCQDGASWATMGGDHVRVGRVMVSGSNMAHHSSWFTDIFDVATVLDPTRGNIPA